MMRDATEEIFKSTPEFFKKITTIDSIDIDSTSTIITTTFKVALMIYG